MHCLKGQILNARRIAIFVAMTNTKDRSLNANNKCKRSTATRFVFLYCWFPFTNISCWFCIKSMPISAIPYRSKLALNASLSHYVCFSLFVIRLYFIIWTYSHLCIVLQTIYTCGCYSHTGIVLFVFFCVWLSFDFVPWAQQTFNPYTSHIHSLIGVIKTEKSHIFRFSFITSEKSRFLHISLERRNVGASQISNDPDMDIPRHLSMQNALLYFFFCYCVYTNEF